MIDDLLNLWITRLSEQDDWATPDPKTSSLSRLIDDPRANVLVATESLDDGRALVIDALRRLAYRDAGFDQQAEEVTGWLVVDVPLPNGATPEQLVHRMIRRLYFAAVLHGLGEVSVLRDAVQSLRLSYLQTRGVVTTTHSNESTGTFEAGLSLDLTQPIKLTASEEVKVAESLSAQMQRMSVFEAEDQLVYDLHILMQLNEYITTVGKIVGRTLPRWEQVRAFFKACYARVRKKSQFRLRPLFVFEAVGLGAGVTLMNLLSKAASLAAAQGAQIVVLAGAPLVRAHGLDRDLDLGVFRGQFQVYDEHIRLMPVELKPSQAAMLRDLLGREPPPPPGVAALLEAMLPPELPSAQP